MHPMSRGAFYWPLVVCAALISKPTRLAAAQQEAPATTNLPFTVAAEGSMFRLRLAWPRAADDMPVVQMRPGSLRLVLRVPVAALGPETRVPDLPQGMGPVRSLTVQISGDQGLIILALRQPARYEMRQVGAAWILDMDAGNAMASNVTAAATSSHSAPAPAVPAPAIPQAAVAPPSPQPVLQSGRPPSAAGPAGAPDAPGAETLIVEVTVNAQRLRDLVQAERTTDGKLVLPVEAWTEARLKPLGEQAPLADGLAGYALDSVEGLVYSMDRRRQTLSITAPPQAFVGQAFDGRQPLAAAPPRPQPGFLVNYDLSASMQTQGPASTGAMVEGIFFNQLGSWVGHALVSDSGGQRRVRRLDTFWQLDLPNRMESLVLGDATGTPGAWSRPVRYAGIRWGTDFGLRPGFVTLPQPTLAGSAALPSTVDVLINNQQRLSRSVPPGPFTLSDVPLIAGAGEVNLVVRDLLGRETIVRQSYYVSPRLLAPGLDDYSFEAGRLRTGYGSDVDAYGDPFATATWRRGLSSGITAEARFEVEPGRRAGGVEVAGLLGTWAVGRASLARSSSDSESGSRLLLGVERSGSWGGGSLQWERYGAGFTPLAQVAGEVRPRERLLANVGGRLFGPVAGGVSYTRQTNWNAAPVAVLAASMSVPLPQQFSLSLFYSRELTGMGGWRGGLTLTRPLGDGVFATSTVNRGSDGRLASEVQATSTTPTGPGIGWRVAAGNSESRALSGGLNMNTSSTELTADIETSRQGAAAARLGMRGSLGRLAGLGFASRPIGRGAFAVVRVGELEGVPVLRSHQVVALTDGQGLAFVPGLLPYQANVIEVDPTEMSLDAEFATTRIEVTPYARSGALVDFAVRTSRGALVELVEVDGSAVPVGAQARLASGGASFTVARRGEVYMTGLEQSNTVEVTWPGKRCDLIVELPATGESLPRIGPLTCLERGSK